MDKQKIIKYSLVTIVAVSFLGYLIHKITGSTDASPFSPTETIVVANAEASGFDSNIKKVNVFMDFSGSMRGYVDFANHQDCKAIMNSVVCNVMTAIDTQYDIISYAHCGNRHYTTTQCISAFSDRSIFNQNTTLLDEMIKLGCDSANDTCAAIVVSDMIQSFRKRKLIQERDTFYNKNHLSDLGSKIMSAVNPLKKKGMHITILQYLSDYNGKYYCNYTENLKPVSFKDEILRDRPFYVMLIGSENNIKGIVSNIIFNISKKPTHIYSTIRFDLKKDSTNCSLKSLKSESKDWTFMEGEDEKSTTLCYSLQGQNLDEEKSEITFSIPANITVPFYLDQNISLDYDTLIFSSGNLDISKCEIKLTLLPYNKLKEEDSTSVKLISSIDWCNDTDTDDDVILSADGLKGKTWGFSTLIENISNVYSVQDKTAIAQINLLLTKK